MLGFIARLMGWINSSSDYSQRVFDQRTKSVSYNKWGL